ncbi:cytochrome-c oxidase, cbb3-type subunit III [Puniceibacterium sediminis]|uniref:Cbb3-type cytochrome c oxidase subunit n=1 Tax=Puniceibacterium sediminis TaxID=1608407 RepID=A0A238VEE2_9RHOB|nr:cytochrome-c oxidase, cbb3-type subunit III [Puniceibacterium sediminis]SNR32534.1 cytochrome c oxidase cbb3-type subunit 3 [Puniceibacterium sediminis]
MTTHEDDKDVGTTGHSWDGIEELNNPLPRWWLWTLYATIVWAVGYTILFPAWPLVSGATSGVLGWSTRGAVAEEIAAVDAAQSGLRADLEATDLNVLQSDAPLHHFAVQAGASLFANNCAQCHGAGAAGATGYPNLLDDDWLWGGQIEQIATTIRHGIRNTEDPDAHFSQMPAFGDILSRPEIDTLVVHIQSMSDGADPLAGEGGQLFADNCAACHGEDAKGDREMGAPNLTDAIWLYGSDTAALTSTISKARFGVMPAWGPRLDEAEVRALAAYVHQLGGGEATSEE